MKFTQHASPRNKGPTAFRARAHDLKDFQIHRFPKEERQGNRVIVIAPVECYRYYHHPRVVSKCQNHRIHVPTNSRDLEK